MENRMKPRVKSWVVLAVVFVALGLLTVPHRVTVSAPQTDPPAYGRGYDASVFDVKSFGARADGKTLDTPAINKAIDAAAAAGGGTAVVLAGNFLSSYGTFKS